MKWKEKKGSNVCLHEVPPDQKKKTASGALTSSSQNFMQNSQTIFQRVDLKFKNGKCTARWEHIKLVWTNDQGLR